MKPLLIWVNCSDIACPGQFYAFTGVSVIYNISAFSFLRAGKLQDILLVFLRDAYSVHTSQVRLKILLNMKGIKINPNSATKFFNDSTTYMSI